jgi:4-carboxymuconolactone decarboxylase
VDSSEDVLRKLTIGDPVYCRVLVQGQFDDPRQTLDARSAVLVRLGSLITSGAAAATWQQYIGLARNAGLSPDEIVGSLVALAPLIGITRLVAAAPSVAEALGFDVDAALFAWEPTAT